jgi:hypothetical protein
MSSISRQSPSEIEIGTSQFNVYGGGGLALPQGLSETSGIKLYGGSSLRVISSGVSSSFDRVNNEGRSFGLDVYGGDRLAVGEETLRTRGIFNIYGGAVLIVLPEGVSLEEIKDYTCDL